MKTRYLRDLQPASGISWFTSDRRRGETEFTARRWLPIVLNLRKVNLARLCKLEIHLPKNYFWKRLSKFCKKASSSASKTWAPRDSRHHRLRWRDALATALLLI